MKKYIIIVLVLFLIISCWKKEEKWIIEDSTKIIDNYTNTLEWTIKDAHDIKKIVDINQQNLQDKLDNIK